MKLEDVSKNSVLEDLEYLLTLDKFFNKLFDLNSNLKDSFWTGITKSVIVDAIASQEMFINDFRVYLQNCIDALPNLDEYKKQAVISGEKKMALYNFENSNSLQTSAPYAAQYDDANQRRTHASLKKEYNNALNKKNELKQKLIDIFNRYALKGNPGSLSSSSTDNRIYNIDKIENYYNDFEDLSRELQSKYIDEFESGYIYSCDNDVIVILKNVINQIFHYMKENNSIILNKWSEIINVLKAVYSSTNVANGGSPSGYSSQESTMPELILIDKTNSALNVSKVPGRVSDDELASNAKVEEVKYPDIRIGSSVGNFDVSKGHMSAADAVNARDTRNLINKYVNSDNSKFKSFAIVNEDGTVSNIERADGLSLQEYCEKYGVDIGRVAVDVSDKNGTSQAWISVNELNENQEELSTEQVKINSSNDKVTTTETQRPSINKTANEIISQYIDNNPNVRGFAVINENGNVSNAELASNMSFREFCEKYDVNEAQVAINLNNTNDSSNNWVSVKEIINK